MPDVKIDIKGDATQFKAECKAAEEAANRTKQKLAQDTGKVAEKIGGKLGAGGLGGGGIAGIATAGAIAIGTKALDLYMEAQTKAAEAMKRNAAEAGYAAEQEAKRAAAIINTTNAIAQLNSAELNSNANKEKALQLLQQMQRRYSGLTVAIDKNGRVTEESLKAAQKLALQRQMASVKAQMNENEQTRTHYVEMSNDPLVNLRGKSEEYALAADGLANENRKLGNTLHELSIQLREVDTNFANRKKMFAAQEKDIVESAKKETDKTIRRLGRGTAADERAYYIEDRIEAVKKSNGGRLSDTARAELSKMYGNEYDEKTRYSQNQRMLDLQETMKIRRLELQGKKQEAELARKIAAESKAKGRYLTKNELKMIRAENDTEFAFKRAQEAEDRAKLGRPNVANPWQSDSLIQMGEKVNMVQSINYPQKTFTSVSQIEKMTEKIWQTLDGMEGGTFA